MAAPPDKKDTKVNLIVLLIALGFLLILFAIEFLLAPTLGAGEKLESLTNLQELTMQTLIEKTNLLISLSTGLFGLMGYFIVYLTKKEISTSKFTRIVIILTIGFTILSIHLGYLYLHNWGEMLFEGIFRPFDPMLATFQKLQFFSFLTAIIFAAITLYNIKLSKV